MFLFVCFLTKKNIVFFVFFLFLFKYFLSYVFIDASSFTFQLCIIFSLWRIIGIISLV